MLKSTMYLLSFVVFSMQGMDQSSHKQHIESFDQLIKVMKDERSRHVRINDVSTMRKGPSINGDPNPDTSKNVIKKAANQANKVE